MPFLAVTAPPSAPSEVADGDGEADGEADGDGELLAVPPGTVVASAPSRISTWPAATVELAVAVTPNCDAILLALAEVPVPYKTSVVVSGLVFATFPAVYPSLV